MQTLLLILIAGALLAADVPPITFPANAGVHDLKADYGAKGDGASDDTAAFQAAFKANSNGHMKTVYVPEGTYLVSDQVWFEHWMFLQGAGRERTVIRLKDRCPGFQDAAKPRAVLGTTNPAPSPDNNRNMEFSVHVLDLTVDIGRGNPGADGIEFLSNNGGGLERVRVLAAEGGRYGVDCTRLGQGPSYIKHLEVRGFEVGMAFAGNAFVAVAEDVALIGYRRHAITNSDCPVVMRRLRSEGPAPAIVQVKREPARKNGQALRGGHLVLLDSELKASGAKGPAVRLDDGGCFFRGIRAEGFTGDILTAQGLKPFGTEFALPAMRAADGKPARSLGLEIAESPDVPWEDPVTWADGSAGATPLDAGNRKATDRMWDKPFEGKDVTASLQQAVDSGAATVYLPHGSYIIRKSLRIPASLRVLQGNGSILVADHSELAGKALFVVDAPGPQPFFIDRLSAGGLEGKHEQIWSVEHRAARSLVIAHSRWLSYRSLPGAGDAFIDDLCGAPLEFGAQQRVWLRSYNSEGGFVKLRNHAAKAWFLSFKSEGTGTMVENLGPEAETEVLGGFHFPANWPPEGPAYQTPLFIAGQGRLCAVLALEWANEVLWEQRGAQPWRIEAKPGTSRWLHAVTR